MSQGREHGAPTASPGKPRPPQPRGPTDGAASGFAAGRGRAVNPSPAAPPVRDRATLLAVAIEHLTAGALLDNSGIAVRGGSTPLKTRARMLRDHNLCAARVDLAACRRACVSTAGTSSSHDGLKFLKPDVA